MAIITKLLFVGLSLFLILAAPVQAQETPGAGHKIQFHEVSFDEEGSVAVINQIVVDGAVLWVGTDDGLWRFDGHAAQCWDGSCSNPDESIHIHSLLIDSENRLWIGTSNSLIVLNADRDWSKRVEPLPELDGRVWVLEAAPDGAVWVGTERGLYHVALAAGTTISPETTDFIELPAEEDDDILALAQTDSGDLWIGTRTSGLILLQPADDGQSQITEIAQTRPQINAVLVGEEGELWVGKENGLCTLLSGDSDPVCRTPPFDEDRIEQLPITGIFPDPSTPGAIWIATPVQLWHYAPSSDPAAVLLPADVRTMAGDTDDCKDVRTMDDGTDGCKDFRTMAGDDEGQLWAGATTGLFRHQPDAWQPLLDDADPANVRAILQDGQGVLWLGTDRGLLKQEPGGSLQAVQIENSELPAIRCLFASQYDGSLWACLDLDEGVAQIPLDAAGDPLVLKRFLPDQTVNDIWQDAAGTLWFATKRGVWQKTGDSEPRQHLSRDDSAAGPASNFVTALAGDGQGGFWAGTTAGLSHFDGSSWQPPACLPPDGEGEIVSINDLVWDGARNQLWVAAGDGLALCDGEKYSARPLEGNLSYNDIQTLLLVGAPGGDGEPAFLLLGTPEGLSRVDISDPSLEKLPVTSFSALTGLRDNLIQALYTRDDGRLLLGAPSGLFVYQPSNRAPESSFYHENLDSSVFESLRQPGESLTIGYNDFAPLKVIAHDLRTAADNLIYRFEITNGDETEKIWSDSGEIDLSEDRLPKGKELAVTAWAYDGDFNQSAPAILQITREREPLEQRPEFQAFIIILTIAIIALISWLLRWLRFEPYQNLEVTISPISEKPDFQQVQVRGGRWLFNAPNQLQKGSNRWFFEIPAEERPRNFDALETKLGQITKLDEMADIDQKLALLQEVGRKLYASLFSDETTALLRDKLGLGDKPVRLRLVIEPELTGADALPWELLYGGDGLWFLTIDSDVALVRDYPIATTTPNKVKNELKVLLLISSPRDLPLKKETINKEIEALKSFTTPDNLKITRHATQEDLQDLTAGRYDLIHFLGHGDIDDGQAVLYFEDEGYALPIYQDVLVEHLKTAKPTLVFLNACRSAKSDDPDSDNLEIEIADSQKGSSSLATALVKEANVAAVVGMGYEVDSEAANEFSRAFYQKLIQLGQVDDAVANGREVLSTRNTFDRMASVASRDWFTPRLYVGLKDNAIYKQSLLRQHRLLQAIRSRSAKSDEISEE